MTVRDGNEIVKVIKMLDTLLLEYKQEEIDYPFAVDNNRYAFYQGRKKALIELKKRYIEEMR
jgi:hypothetical protein